MKRTLILLLLATCCPCLLTAQTADDWINAGRSNLAAHDIVAANAAFAQALNASPTNETANALFAVTRLLTLPDRPAGSNLLTRLGFPDSGRNIYDWTSLPASHSDGFPLVPAGLNVTEFVSELRGNVLPEIAGAIGNLSAITDTNFILNLSGSETAMTAVTVDYGDCKLIQAGLYGAAYLIDTLNAQNLDLQLASLYDLYTNGMLSASRVLKEHPQLLTLADTNDLPDAFVAFTNAVDTYMTASAFIRARTGSDIRLFNYDATVSAEEADFRTTLQDLNNSLFLGPQYLPVNASLRADISPLFDGSLVLRDLLPQLNGNAIQLGSFPDLTFGGSIFGLSQDDVEGFFGRSLAMIPVGNVSVSSAPDMLGITFNTLRGHHYVLETSGNLLDWQTLTNFTAQDVSILLLDSFIAGRTQQFYRLKDDTGLHVPPTLHYYFDDFNRADGSLGNNWTNNYWCDTDIVIFGNAAFPVHTNVHAFFYWTNTVADDQFSQATLVGVGDWSGLSVRGGSAADYCYFGFVFGTNDSRIYVRKPGTDYSLVTDYKTVWSSGDVIKLTVNGSSPTKIHLWQNGTNTLTFTDWTNTVASGHAGIAFATADQLKLDDWSGGDVQVPVLALPYTDHFDYGDGRLDRQDNWSLDVLAYNYYFGAQIMITNHEAIAFSSAAHIPIIFTGANFASDQFCSLGVGTVANYFGPAVRMNDPIGARHFYLAYFGASGFLTLYAFDEGTYQILTTGSAAVSPGDTVTLEASGANPVHLVVKHNGSQVISYDDSTYLYTTGRPGFVLSDFGGAPTLRSATVGNL